MAKLTLKVLSMFLLTLCMVETVSVYAAASNEISENIAQEVVEVCDTLLDDSTTYIVGDEVKFLGKGGELIIPPETCTVNFPGDQENPYDLIFLLSRQDCYCVEIKDIQAEVLILFMDLPDGPKVVLSAEIDEDEDEVKLRDCIGKLLQREPRSYRIVLRNSEIRKLYIANGTDTRMVPDVEVKSEDTKDVSLIIQYPAEE